MRAPPSPFSPASLPSVALAHPFLHILLGSPPSQIFLFRHSLALLLALLLRLLLFLHLACSPPPPRVLSLWGQGSQGEGLSGSPCQVTRPCPPPPPACADSSRLEPEGLFLAGPAGAPASLGLHVGLRLQTWGCLVGSLVFWLRPLAHLQSVNTGMVSPVSQITEGQPLVETFIGHRRL